MRISIICRLVSSVKKFWRGGIDYKVLPLQLNYSIHLKDNTIKICMILYIYPAFNGYMRQNKMKKSCPSFFFIYYFCPLLLGLMGIDSIHVIYGKIILNQRWKCIEALDWRVEKKFLLNFKKFDNHVFNFWNFNSVVNW